MYSTTVNTKGPKETPGPFVYGFERALIFLNLAKDPETIGY